MSTELHNMGAHLGFQKEEGERESHLKIKIAVILSSGIQKGGRRKERTTKTFSF